MCKVHMSVCAFICHCGVVCVSVLSAALDDIMGVRRGCAAELSRHSQRERERERDSQRERKRETERERKRERLSERARQRKRETERKRKRER
mgnify:CR=1 FL=1